MAGSFVVVDVFVVVVVVVVEVVPEEVVVGRHSASTKREKEGK